MNKTGTGSRRPSVNLAIQQAVEASQPDSSDMHLSQQASHDYTDYRTRSSHSHHPQIGLAGIVCRPIAGQQVPTGLRGVVGAH